MVWKLPSQTWSEAMFPFMLVLSAYETYYFRYMLSIVLTVNVFPDPENVDEAEETNTADWILQRKFKKDNIHRIGVASILFNSSSTSQKAI